MNREIEDMANDLAKICPDLVENCCGQVNCVTHLTLALSKLGYRKSTDVAREIFDEVERKLIFIRDADTDDIRGVVTIKDITRIKKKYESED